MATLPVINKCKINDGRMALKLRTVIMSMSVLVGFVCFLSVGKQCLGLIFSGRPC